MVEVESIRGEEEGVLVEERGWGLMWLDFLLERKLRFLGRMGWVILIRFLVEENFES